MWSYSPIRSEQDWQDALAVYRSNRHYLRLIDPCEPTSDSVRRDLRRFPPALAPEQCHACLIKQAGETVGIIHYLTGFPDAGTAYIGLLMLHGSRQNQGLGGRIVAGFCQQMRGAGLKRLRLSVLHDNTDARRFWQKQGFAPVCRKMSAFRHAHGSRMKTVFVLEKPLEPISASSID
ncbi:GNAT family N-acetyltransferase [Conchiformibius kuhniae]|uniref:GNAT family N-acetyltransferase n=1 Tax=Conchiformibius kuhniae TaxID=211502 RepID=A0A8T9MXT9_9NEIS|nr:GNAT family N-acetyltransferase [Conchiformibius kuhniae]